MPSHMAVLAARHGTHALPTRQLGKAHTVQEFVDALIHAFPQIMRQAAFVVVTVGLAAATRGIDTLIDRGNDIRHGNLGGGAPQHITTPRTA